MFFVTSCLLGRFLTGRCGSQIVVGSAPHRHESDCLLVRSSPDNVLKTVRQTEPGFLNPAALPVALLKPVFLENLL